MLPPQAQLTLVFGNSRPNLKHATRSSVKRKMLRASSSLSFEKKYRQLAQQNPGAAALIEKLVDDVLAG